MIWRKNSGGDAGREARWRLEQGKRMVELKVKVVLAAVVGVVLAVVVVAG